MLDIATHDGSRLMTLAWTDKEPRSIGMRGRLIAYSLAAAACLALTYLAVTQRFGAIAELFPDSGTVTTIVEDQPKPPPIVPSRPQPPPPQQATLINPEAPPTPTAEILLPAEPPATSYLNATFLERPSGRDFERFYPHRALERGVSGRVVLDCNVAANGRLSCAVASEDPAGWGFGDASLRAAQQFRVAPATADGAPTSGGRLRVPMTWQVS
jgi:protein TonB